MNLRDLPDMSDALKTVQMYEKKKLDPVGKEDGDIDNDGDKDKTDSYLLNRRKTVTKALGKKTHLCAKMVKKEGKEYQTIPEQHTMLEDGTVTHYDITDGETILENVPVEELEILIAEAHEHFDNYDKNAEVLGEGYGKKKKMKKEAFYFTDEEIADMDEIDEATDEELIDFFVEMIQELAEDEDDLLEICEALEEVEMLAEVSDKYYDSAVKSSKAAAKANRPSRVERMKSAAKAAGSKLKAGAKAAGSAAKKGIKAAGKSVAANAGKAVGTFQANRIKAKRAELSKKDAPKKEAPKSSSSDDDGTGGKLDALLSKTRGTSSSSSSSSGGGGERDAGSEARSRMQSKKKGPGLLSKIGGAVKKGLKKAVGKTARAVSSGSGKLASRLGEDYDRIAHLYESGLFSIQEIESVIEEGYKEIDKKKETAMYRRAGNLSREALSKGMNTKEGSKAQDKSGKIVSAISRQKEKERFSKMADIKARSNYGG